MKNQFTLQSKMVASLLVAIGCLTSDILPKANANLVVNGDFETGVPSPWTGFAAGIPGVSIFGSGPYIADFIGSGGQIVTIAQSIPTLVVGQSYIIGFDYRGTGQANVNVTLGGATGTLLVGASSSWQSYVNTVTITSGTTLSISHNPSGLNHFYIDNVSVELVAVPEPTTMIAGALLLLPFGSSALQMLRNRRAT